MRGFKFIIIYFSSFLGCIKIYLRDWTINIFRKTNYIPTNSIILIFAVIFPIFFLQGFFIISIIPFYSFHASFKNLIFFNIFIINYPFWLHCLFRLLDMPQSPSFLLKKKVRIKTRSIRRSWPISLLLCH